MIIKYPLWLALFVPIIIGFFLIKDTPSTHAIQFPKAAWLGSLASKKGARLLALDTVIQWAVIGLIILALSQPQWVQSKQRQTKKGIDIVAVLDTSGSMNAEDFTPKNRMTVAKETLSAFIKKRVNDRVGLIIFGADAMTQAPLTFDHTIVLDRMGQASVGDAGDGTAIGLAVATAVNRLMSSDAVSKLIILITDGVNNAGPIDPISAATLAKNNDIKLYAIGIGTKKGAPIPIYHPTYGKRYARYSNGQMVLTEFDDTTLKSMAQIANGRYFNATNARELDAIYNEIDQLEKTVINTANHRVVYDIFPYIIGGIILLVILRELMVLSTLIGVRT
jgi:Ca-activated chloride channel family protein